MSKLQEIIKWLDTYVIDEDCIVSKVSLSSRKSSRYFTLDDVNSNRLATAEYYSLGITESQIRVQLTNNYSDFIIQLTIPEDDTSHKLLNIFAHARVHVPEWAHIVPRLREYEDGIYLAKDNESYYISMISNHPSKNAEFLVSLMSEADKQDVRDRLNHRLFSEMIPTYEDELTKEIVELILNKGLK